MEGEDAMHDMSPDDTIAIIKDLGDLLAKGDDVKAIQEVHEGRAALAAICERKDLEAKEIIREMLEDNENIKSALVPPPSKHEMSKELDEVYGRQREARHQIDRLQGQLASNAEETKALEDKKLALEASVQEARKQHSVAVPRVSHSLSLYATISGIQWDYDRQDALAGVVAKNDKVEAFELDPSKMSKIEIADSLWDLIAQN